MVVLEEKSLQVVLPEVRNSLKTSGTKIKEKQNKNNRVMVAMATHHYALLLMHIRYVILCMLYHI